MVISDGRLFLTPTRHASLTGRLPQGGESALQGRLSGLVWERANPNRLHTHEAVGLGFDTSGPVHTVTESVSFHAAHIFQEFGPLTDIHLSHDDSGVMGIAEADNHPFGYGGWVHPGSR